MNKTNLISLLIILPIMIISAQAIPAQITDSVKEQMKQNAKDTNVSTNSIDLSKPAMYMTVSNFGWVSYCIGDCETSSQETGYFPIKVNIWTVGFKNWQYVPVNIVIRGNCAISPPFDQKNYILLYNQTKKTDSNGEARFAYDLRNNNGMVCDSAQLFVKATSPTSGRQVFYLTDIVPPANYIG